MGDVDFDDSNWETRDYDKFVAYGASKTANILHMVELDRRLQGVGVRAYSVNPGAVATSLARHMSSADFSMLRKYASASTAAKGRPTDGHLDFTTPDHGAATQVWAAASPELENTGSVYLEDCRISSDVAPYAIDQGRAARLWELSETLCGETAGSVPE
jgi:NAD(P)-dependent dehydrogenase (short-subunit alcohol dehydrogenase family)